MNGTVEAVESHYDVFPYPTIQGLSYPLPVGFKRAAMDMLLRRRQTERLPPDANIWIAGCGTQQATLWALSFPEGKVLASDISTKTLERAAELASNLGVDNVVFEQRDLMDADSSGELRERFDLVVSSGVVHHLPKPETGLQTIRAALKPTGAALLMVYSRVHRQPLETFRSVLETLSHGDEDHDARYALMSTLLDAWLGSERCSIEAREAFETLKAKCATDRSFVADCLLHPLEHSYDVDGVLGLLSSAGLRHTNWLRPDLWCLDHYIDSDEILGRFATADPVTQWRMVYAMAGHKGPMLFLLAEPIEAPTRAPYDVRELLAMPLMCRVEHAAIKIDQALMPERGTVPAFAVEGDMLVPTVGGPFGDASDWRLPAYVEPMLRAFDGQRPAGEVLKPYADEFGPDAVIRLLPQLTPLDLGLLAPNW